MLYVTPDVAVLEVEAMKEAALFLMATMMEPDWTQVQERTQRLCLMVFALGLWTPGSDWQHSLAPDPQCCLAARRYALQNLANGMGY